MHAEIGDRGAILLERALPELEIFRLARRVERAFLIGRWQEKHGLAPTALKESLVWGGMVGRTLRLYVGPILYDRVAGAAEQAARSILGWRTRLIPSHCVFRRYTEAITHVPWHIDADGANTIAFDACFNVWVPLVPVGRDRPSLEIIPGSDAIMRRLPLREPRRANLSDEWVRDNLPSERWCPELSPGDVLIFSHFTAHRTQTMGNHPPRVSGEFRVTLRS